jgi:predicted DNA-binding transcriptional regulator YafY
MSPFFQEAKMRADRLISLMLLLQRKGRMTCADIARELEVSRRTILRDVDALSYSGVPLLTEGGPGGGVWLRDDYRTSLTGLKDDELRALLLSSDGALLGDLGWKEAYASSRLKLDAALPAASVAAAEIAQRRILIDSRGWWPQEPGEDTLSRLQAAVLNDQPAEFDYERYDGQTGHVRAEAYALVAKTGAWYFIGKRGNELRSYRTSRIASLAIFGERFERDPGFDVRSWWPVNSESFSREFSAYRCVLEVGEKELRLIGHMAPGRVRVLRGGEPAEVELRVESEWYAALIVIGIGGACRIIEPENLKLSTLGQARRTIDAIS